MRILITAGGTIVKIDDVRHIGNFSTGSFPAKIADAALIKGHSVIYLHAKNAKIPAIKKKLKLFEYETYDDYARQLKIILKKNDIDVAFLAAAVSDYGVKQSKGKISSSKPSLVIRLFRLPKVIKGVKRWSRKPLFQVGFKLLSGVNQKELFEVAYKSSLENHSDLTIANDLSNIHKGKRGVILVTPEKGLIKLQEPKLAEKIISFVEKRSQVQHFSTVLSLKKNINKKFRREIILFKRLCHQLSKQGHMPDFYQGAESGHGSLALRTSKHGFLITARGSNKKSLRPHDVVFVKKVDWKKREIFVESATNEKASFNAILVANIFKKLPSVKAVVHTHKFFRGVPSTEFPFMPGTLQYAVIPAHLFRDKTRVINLKNHGLIAVGTDLQETVNHVLR